MYTYSVLLLSVTALRGEFRPRRGRVARRVSAPAWPRCTESFGPGGACARGVERGACVFARRALPGAFPGVGRCVG
eukprot:8079055-Lingulodinium_polyedra.AAC.1